MTALETICIEYDETGVCSLGKIDREGTFTLIPHVQSNSLQQTFTTVLDAHPDDYVLWCHAGLKSFMRPFAEWSRFLNHPLEILHWGGHLQHNLPLATLGSVDFDSPFLIPTATDIRYATWLISSLAGIGKAAVFSACGFNTFLPTFHMSLLSIGKMSLQTGVCCYAEPRLSMTAENANLQMLGKVQPQWREIAALIVAAYGKKWLAFWFAGRLCFDRRVPLPAFFQSWRQSPSLAADRQQIAKIHEKIQQPVASKPTVDAIIPTLGRPQHVVNLLHDLAAQTVPVSKAIIVEQSPTGNFSELLVEAAAGDWPFVIQHFQVETLGAGRARNLALKEVVSDWILLLDDDIRISADWVKHLWQTATAYHVDVVTSAVHLPTQQPRPVAPPSVWGLFASGVSLLSRQSSLSVSGFDLQLDGGFGEDYEYGVRLRLAGSNILYTNQHSVLHLKAPIGGGRVTYPHPWHKDPAVSPKPSPTVMYSRQKHHTLQMEQGYRLYYWSNYFATFQIIKRLKKLPFRVRQWRQSQRWAKFLAQKSQEQGNTF